MNCFVSNKLQFSNINGTVYVMAILYQKVTRFDYMDYMGGGGQFLVCKNVFYSHCLSRNFLGLILCMYFF